jgi:hypothetical protein
MYGLRPVPFKDGTLLFLELLSTGFAVISVQQRGMEIGVNGVCGQFRKSDRWASPIFFGPGTPRRTLGTRPGVKVLCGLGASRISSRPAKALIAAVPHSPLFSLRETQTQSPDGAAGAWPKSI